MRIVFEGISSIDKNAILNEFTNYLKLSNIDYVCTSDLFFNNSFKDVIKQLVKKEYNTQENKQKIFYESLILVANLYYKQWLIDAYLRMMKNILLLDKDKIGKIQYFIIKIIQDVYMMFQNQNKILLVRNFFHLNQQLGIFIMNIARNF